MLNGIKSLLVTGLLLCSTSCLAAEHPELKAFPAAEEGMTRFVIVLPEVERGPDNDLKVELIPGKVMMTDGVNLMRHGSSIEPRPLQGWGYTFYEVVGQDVAMSTMMAAPEGADQKEAFVAGTPLLIRYNSRLPVVVYAPEGYEIHYRTWRADPSKNSAEIK